MAGNHSSTTHHNQKVLIKDLGLKQVANTTVYRKTGIFVLSPSIQNQYNWFDLRKVNLDKYNRQEMKGYLLIRLFDTFLLTDLNDFLAKMISEENFVETKVSGVHWKFNIKNLDNTYWIINQTNKKQYPAKELSVDDLKQIFGVSTIT